MYKKKLCVEKKITSIEKNEFLKKITIIMHGIEKNFRTALRKKNSNENEILQLN